MTMKKTILQNVLRSGLVMILLLLFLNAFAFASELDDVKAAIEGKGAKWIAGETSVSKLPPELRKLRAGSIEPEITGKEKLLSVEASLLGLPISLDWSNYVTPVRNQYQDQCGSCWAFATTAALESYTLIKSNLPGQELDLAEQILVSCSGAGSCSGGAIDRACNFIRDTGLPEEGCYPYTHTNGSCASACPDWPHTYRIDSWSYVATISPRVDNIKNALYTYGPLVTTMQVYSDFFNYISGIYSHTGGTYEFLHAILIIGYNDSEKCFIAKNSWGTGWGEGGFFNIAYSEIKNPVGFGQYTIAYHDQEAVCTYSISPTSQSFSAAGGIGTINVMTDPNCRWTAGSNTSWITIVSGGSGTGVGSVGYKVSENKAKAKRTGTISVAGQQFTVNQSGR